MKLRGIIVALSIVLTMRSSFGQALFIHQQDVELTIPIMKDSFNTLKVYPIIQLKFSDLQSDATSLYKFSLRKAPDFLTIKETTGELHFHHDRWTGQKQVKNLKAQVKNLATNQTAKTTMTFNFIKMDKKQFCVSYCCFYDSIRYMTSEFNFRKSTYEQVIGDLNPPLYQRICEPFETFHYIENGTEFVLVSTREQLIKEPRLDYDNMPNSNLSIEVTCELKDNFLKDVATKKRLLNITVVDRNDNMVYVDDESENVEIIHHGLEFIEGELVNRSVVVIFRDRDSLEANRNIQTKMFDDHKMFSHVCTPTTWFNPDESLTSSAFICDVLFSHSGQFNESRYCFQLKAFDTNVKKKHQATSNICVTPIRESNIESSTTVVHAVNQTSSTQEINVNSIRTSLYPSEVELLGNASYLSRVIQPLNYTDESGFTLTANPFEIFNITSTGGIIYVARPRVLSEALPASFMLEVSWNEHRQQIKILFMQSNNSSADSIDSFCSHHEHQTSCENSYGVGSRNGRCKWRPHQGNELISKIFATCVADLDFCSDQICDPLEETGSSFGFQICPQDCSKEVFGNVNAKPIGISSSSKSNVCTCDEFENCVCAPVYVTATDFHLSTETSTSTTTFFPFYPENTKCGSECIAMLIGIPSAVIVLIFATFMYFASRHIHEYQLRSASLESCEKSSSGFVNASASTLAKCESINEVQSHCGYPDFYSRHWEIDIRRVRVEGIIGEGEFGKVMSASLKSFKERDSMMVAIKTVKDVANDSEMTSLKKEFEQLQKVSIHPHPNVITLIGCYSKGLAPWIFLEFCVYESLKDYLLASRLIPQHTNTDCVDKVTTDDILRFCLQITSGMAHLAELKLVHRDLAARNVLLSEGKVCKISDFGLTRNVCNACDTYSKCSNDKVPVKWMAPESLSSAEEYTTKSDVWAFGILGYEVIMLGSSPYPGILVNHMEILTLLLNGYRMQRPPNCSQQLFDIFKSCWADAPSKRPSFSELTKKFDDLMVLRNATYQAYYNVPGGMIWSTPEFTDEERRDYDEVFYRAYIERVKLARETFNGHVIAQKSTENRSEAGELTKAKSISCHSSPPNGNLSASMRTTQSLNHVDNERYDSNFDAMTFLKMKQASKNRTISFDTSSGTSSVGSGSILGYLPMKPVQPILDFLSASRNESSESTLVSSSSGYVQMENFIKNNSSSSSSAIGGNFSA